MNRYYYTFGTHEQFPYCRGWVEVLANDWHESHAKYRAKFPDVNEDIINCAMFYTEEQFKKTCMWLERDKYKNEKCHEVIE